MECINWDSTANYIAHDIIFTVKMHFIYYCDEKIVVAKID